MISTRTGVRFLEHWLQRRCETGETPGLAVALIDGDEALTRSFGTAGDAPMAADTRMPIASLTKAFTATAILQLVADAKLTLDDPVVRFVDANIDPAATVRNLLTHTAGVTQAGKRYFGLDGAMHDDPAGVDAVRASNKTLRYSNRSYELASQIVANVSGVGFREFVAQRILQPLEMNDTDFQHDYAATGYLRRLGDGRKPADKRANTYLIPGAADMVSTVTDLAKWAQFWLNGDERVLPARLQDEATRTQWYEPGRRTRWGLGWQIHDGDDGDRAAHDGLVCGWHHAMRLDRANHCATIVLTNAIDTEAEHWGITAMSALKLTGTHAVEHERFTGVYESDWSRFAIVSDGERLMSLGIDDYEPFDERDELDVTGDDSLLFGSTSIWGPEGENVRFEFGDDGKPSRVLYGADEVRWVGPLATI